MYSVFNVFFFLVVARSCLGEVGDGVLVEVGREVAHAQLPRPAPKVSDAAVADDRSVHVDLLHLLFSNGFFAGAPAVAGRSKLQLATPSYVRKLLVSEPSLLLRPGMADKVRRGGRELLWHGVRWACHQTTRTL